MNAVDSAHPTSFGQIVDAHVHVHPASAPYLLDLMEANGISSVVNMGILEALGIPFSEGMSAFRSALGHRLVYLTTPNFADTSPSFGERMADEFNLLDCFECGSCSYVCPAHIPLVQRFRAAKGLLRKRRAAS